MKSEQKSATKLGEKREAAVGKVNTLRETIEKLAFDESEFNTLEQEKDQISSSVGELSDLVDTLSAQLESRLAFRYADPVRGFDRSKVKGLIAKLIQVKHSAHSTALEVVAGGKLFQVVVDEAITGKAILDRGKLERRVTIIPLDKIQPRRVTNSATGQASNIAKSMNAEAWPAIELVGFDEEVRTAMEYVFGSSIVVDNTKAANQICDATKTRTVTLEGDVYDPSGTISGGSKNNLGTTLSKLCELAAASEKLKEQTSLMASVKAKLQSLKTKSVDFEKLSARIELAEAELAGIVKHLSQTSYGVLVEKFETMSKELEEAQAMCEAMDKEKAEKWDLYHELKDREVELTQDRENRLGQIEEAVKQAKKDVAAKTKYARDAESRSQTLQLELDSLAAEIEAAEVVVVAAEKSLQEASDEESEKQMKVGEVKASYDEAKEQLHVVESRLEECSAELSTLKHAKAALAKNAEAAALEAKKLSVAIARIQKERSNAERLVSTLLKKNAWIESEKSAFGLVGGDYDFEATDPIEMGRHLQALKAEQESLVSTMWVSFRNFSSPQ